MLGSNFEGFGKLRAWGRALTRGSLVCALGALIFAPGCCDTDADCTASDDPCFMNVCQAVGNLPRGRCTLVPATAGTACDDGDVCTDGDSCDGTDQGVCAGDAIPGCCEVDGDCAANQVCDNGTCTDTCSADADCSDGNPCTDDTCDNGVCSNAANTVACDDGDPCTENDVCGGGTCAGTAKDCDNGDFCDGTESCDATGACVSSGSPCAAGETCNETDDTCTAAPACTDDADCQDGIFCNGTEVCNADGECEAGTDPCADTLCPCQGQNDDPICDEADTAAECSCPACPAIQFTLGQDNLTGSSGDDTFDAPIEFNAASGGQFSTLQTGDSANGLAGNDILNASFIAGGTVVPTSLSGIERFNLTNLSGAALTISGTNISGVTMINQAGSVTAGGAVELTVNGLQATTNFGFSNINDNTVDLTLIWPTAAPTTGATDSISCTLDNAIVGNATLNTAAANGFESIDFVSSGTINNRLTALTQTTGTSLATANFSGSANLQVDAFPATIVTYDGTGMSGDLTLGKGTNATNYTTFATNNVKNITGGTGDDMFIFAATFNGSDADGTTEFIDGGAGNDSFQATFASVVGNVVPIKNIENMIINATATGSANLTGVTGITDVTVACDGGVNTMTLLNISGTPLPNLIYKGVGTQAAQACDTINYTSTGTTGAGDSLAVSVGNGGTALNASGTTNNFAIGTLTAPNVESIALDVTDGPATFVSIVGSTLTSFTATSSSNLDLGGGISTGVGNTITSVNAAGVSGDFDAGSTGIQNAANGINITCGSGNDTINIANSAGATSSVITLGAGNDSLVSADTDSADVINAGDGNDTIESHGGSDTIAGGSGTNTFVFTTTATADVNTISDFTPGNAGDVALFDISDLGLAGGTTYVGVIGSLAVNSSEEIAVLTGVGYANQAAADAAINGQVTTNDLDCVYFYFDTTSNTTKIIHMVDPGGGGAGGASTLIGELTNITTQAVHDTLVAANLNSRP